MTYFLQVVSSIRKKKVIKLLSKFLKNAGNIFLIYSLKLLENFQFKYLIFFNYKIQFKSDCILKFN